MEIDRNGLEVLGRDECLRLLASASLGRLGITTGALPTVLPVNFRLVGDQIVFRTGGGTKLDAATDNAVVAFEVDDMDPVWHTGWSVVVTGMAREISDPEELAAIELSTIPHWAPDHATRVVGVSTEIVTGRRVLSGLRHPSTIR
jgi:nitroimidazol reductase NimA-like FMN-containing flavoprotein (pyridoxamine 5'-phosphate oxidase superfamily)